MRRNAPLGHRNMRPVSVSSIHEVYRNHPNSDSRRRPAFLDFSSPARFRRVDRVDESQAPNAGPDRAPTPRVGTLLMPLGMSPSTIEVQP